MIFIVVTADDTEGATQGIAAPVPDGWLDMPERAETLCFGAMSMFLDHQRTERFRLPLGATINMHLEER